MAVYDTPGNVRLSLRLSAGWIKITCQETDQTAVDVIPLNDDPASLEAARSVREHSRRNGDSYDVTVESSDRGHRFLSFGRDPQIGFEISAPQGASVEVSTASADVSGSGIFGDVDVRSASGDIDFDRLTGSATVKTASGDVRFQEAARGADIKTASGDVILNKVGERLGATLVSGDLEVYGVTGSTHASTVSGDIRIEGAAAGDAHLRSVSGDVLFNIEPGCSVWMDVNSLSGSTSSGLELGGPPASGRADLELRATSVSGDIRVSRGRARASTGS